MIEQSTRGARDTVQVIGSNPGEKNPGSDIVVKLTMEALTNKGLAFKVFQERGRENLRSYSRIIIMNQ